MSNRSPLLLLVAALTPACIVPGDAKPTVVAGVDVANAYVHRGMLQNEEGVAQPSAVVRIPAKKDGAIIVRTWANMDLSNDTGDAWLPDGHAGKFSQIDFNFLFEQRLGDNALVTGGFINYNLPNGLEFPFGERGATSEFLMEGVYQLPDSLLSLKPSIAVHYDFDEVEDFYINAGVSHSAGLREDLTLRTRLGLGWMGESQSLWNYGIEEAGLADLTLRGDMDYKLQGGTTLTAFAAYSTIVDSDLSDWFDFIGIDPDQLFGGLGVRWTF